MTLQLWRSSSIIQSARQTDKKHGKTTITLCLRAQVNKDNSVTIKHESNVGKKREHHKGLSSCCCVCLCNLRKYWLFLSDSLDTRSFERKNVNNFNAKLMQVEIYGIFIKE